MVDIMNNIKIKLLWIDDEPSLLSQPIASIKKEIPLDIDFSQDASLSLKKISQVDYDAIILDIYLPIGNIKVLPTAVIEALKANDDRTGVSLVNIFRDQKYRSFLNNRDLADVPVILCSAFTIETLVRNAKSKHFDSVFCIPKSEIYHNPNSIVSILSDVLDKKRHLSNIAATDPLGVKTNNHADQNAAILNFPATFARMLHSHNKIWISLQKALYDTMNFLVPDPFSGYYEMPSGFAESVVKKAALPLIKALSDFFDEFHTRAVHGTVSQESLDNFIKPTEGLTSFCKGDPVIQLSDVLLFVQDIRKSSKPLFECKAFPKERIKQITNLSKDIERMICLYSLHHAWIRVIELEQQSKTASNYIAASSGEKEPPEIFSLQNAVEQVISGLRIYAERAKVRLEFNANAKGAQVKGNKRDIKRAFENIIQNAIKYSHSITSVRILPWVKIDTFVKDSVAHVIVENWGVAIDQDEIKKGLIFQEGYRGVFSNDKGRSGWGIGLADAWLTIKQHGGKIGVESIPSKENSIHYITTFTVEIPCQ